MQHDGFLIIIFLLLGLVIPAVVFLRVYSTAFSGLSSKSSSKNPAAADETAKPEPAQDQKAAERDRQ